MHAEEIYLRGGQWAGVAKGVHLASSSHRTMPQSPVQGLSGFSSWFLLSVDEEKHHQLSGLTWIYGDPSSLACPCASELTSPYANQTGWRSRWERC